MYSKKTMPIVAFITLLLISLACNAVSPRITTESISTVAPSSANETQSPPQSNPTPIPNPVIDLQVGNYTNYRDIIDSLWFVGEIVNNGNAAQSVQVVISLIDSNGSIVGTGSDTITYVSGSGKAPFKILVDNAPSEWAEVKIQIQGELYSENGLFAPYIDLQVDNVSGKVGDYGGYTLTGSVKNTGSKTASLVYVSAVAYDTSGNVIDVGWTYATLNEIAPNGDSPFSLDFSNLTSAPASYEVFAVSSFAE